MAPKKKEKNLKRSNIITLKLTDIELAVISNKIIPILLHAFFLNISVLHSYVVISDRKGNIMLHKLIFLDSNRDSNGLIYGFQTGDQLLHTGGAAALHLIADMSVGFQCERSGTVT